MQHPPSMEFGGLCPDLDWVACVGGKVGSRLPSLKRRNSTSTGIFVGMLLSKMRCVFFRFLGRVTFFEGLMVVLREVYKDNCTVNQPSLVAFKTLLVLFWVHF